MTRALIDTCALVWLLQNNDKKLGADALSVIEDSGVEKLVSPVSFWEIAMKSARPKKEEDKILPPETYKEEIQTVLNLFGIGILPLTTDHTEHLYTLKYDDDHKDPFDRIIVAKAIIERAALISSDGKLYYYGFERVYKNVWTQPSFGVPGASD